MCTKFCSSTHPEYKLYNTQISDALCYHMLRSFSLIYKYIYMYAYMRTYSTLTRGYLLYSKLVQCTIHIMQPGVSIYCTGQHASFLIAFTRCNCILLAHFQNHLRLAQAQLLTFLYIGVSKLILDGSLLSLYPKSEARMSSGSSVRSAEAVLRSPRPPLLSAGGESVVGCCGSDFSTCGCGESGAWKWIQLFQVVF